MRNAVARLGVLLVAAALGAVAWALWFGGEEPAPEEQPAARLYAVEQDAVAGVRVRTAEGEAVFERGPEGWRFASNPLLPVNLDRWGGIVLLLSGPQTDRVLPDPADPAEYGLDAPWTVAVRLADGQETTVRLGAATPDGEHYYAKVEGRAGVALVNAPWGDTLARLVSEPPRPYWFYQVEPSLARVFEVETPLGAVTFLLGLSLVDGEPSARVVVDDAARDLEEEERAELMRLVGGPPVFRVLPMPGDQTLSALGLAPPEAVIRLSYELAAPLGDRTTFSTVYAIGAQTPGGDARYALTDDAAALLAFDAGWVSEALALAERYLAR